MVSISQVGPRVFFSSTAVRVLLRALEEEILRLEAIGATLTENDEWPHDYDPNDLALYRGLKPWLLSGIDAGVSLDRPLSKPMKFLMMLVPPYVKEHQRSLAASEIDSVFRAYADYVAACGLMVLPSEREQLSSWSTWFERLLHNVLSFPRSTSDA
jgi:hypothetical protein